MANLRPVRIAPKQPAQPESRFGVMAEAFEALVGVPEQIQLLAQLVADLQQPDSRELLTVREVAERLSISESKVYELVASGELKGIKIDRLTRIPVVELRRWIAAKLNG